MPWKFVGTSCSIVTCIQNPASVFIGAEALQNHHISLALKCQHNVVFSALCSTNQWNCVC